MYKLIYGTLIVAIAIVLAACSKLDNMVDSQGRDAPVKPNILMVLVDDLGYTDVGLYGGDIATPSLDALGQRGMVFTNAHANPSCAPTRATLMTGRDPHSVGLGSQNGVAPPGVPTTRPGYKGSLEGDYVGLAQVLKEGGYDTYQVGKWHLGHEANQSPGSLGFDHYFSLLDSAASHYGDMLTISLSVSSSGKARYVENGKAVAALPEDFYSTRFYTQWLLDALKNRTDKNKPFFAYLAYTAVHDPLHAPEDLIQKYVNLFKGESGQLKDKRIRGLIRQGLIPDSPKMTRWLSGMPAWEELTDKQQLDLVQRLAVHAAMLEYLDTELGRLVAFLKSSGEYDNTLIVVMSDNGAAALPRTFYAGNAEGLTWQNKAYPLQSVADYGKPGSFPSLSLYNAQAVAGPYFGFKGNVHEGGTRVPMIVKVPSGEHQKPDDSKLHNSGLGHSAADNTSVNRQFVHIADMYTTFADYAGVDLTGQEGLLGCSLKPAFDSQSEQVCHKGYGMGYMGWRAYWEGSWKLVFASESFGGTGKYALYNLNDDPGEDHDLSEKYPKKVQQLADKWQAYAAKNGVAVVPMDKVNGVFDSHAGVFFSVDWGE